MRANVGRAWLLMVLLAPGLGLLASSPVGATHEAEEGFEAGRPAGWQLTGLWRVDSACGPAAGGSGYLGYHRAGACDYAGYSNGEATFSVPTKDWSNVTLAFDSRFVPSLCGGCPNYYADRAVFVSLDGGLTWSNVLDEEACSSRAWQRCSANLSRLGSPRGLGVVVSFYFSGHMGPLPYGETAGWFLDNVVVTRNHPNVDPVAVFPAPPGTIVDDDDDGKIPLDVDGTASYDPDGRITRYEWRVSGVLQAETARARLSVPTHASEHQTIALKVFDDKGGSHEATARVYARPNALPIPRPGPDVYVADGDGDGVERVTLADAGSADAEGPIVAWEWRADGRVLGTSPVVADHPFPVGWTRVLLNVTDAAGQYRIAAKNVVVGANRPPLVEAGFDVAAAAGTGSRDATVRLSGSAEDPEGLLADVAWYDGARVVAVGATPIVRLPEGAHTLVLRARDAGGAVTSDTLRVVVAPNAPPEPRAALRCGETACLVDARASSDPEGFPLEYRWRSNGTVTDAVGACVARGPPATLEVTDAAGARAEAAFATTVAPAVPPTPRPPFDPAIPPTGSPAGLAWFEAGCETLTVGFRLRPQQPGGLLEVRFEPAWGIDPVKVGLPPGARPVAFAVRGMPPEGPWTLVAHGEKAGAALASAPRAVPGDFDAASGTASWRVPFADLGGPGPGATIRGANASILSPFGHVLARAGSAHGYAFPADPAAPQGEWLDFDRGAEGFDVADVAGGAVAWDPARGALALASYRAEGGAAVATRSLGSPFRDADAFEVRARFTPDVRGVRQAAVPLFLASGRGPDDGATARFEYVARSAWEGAEWALVVVDDAGTIHRAGPFAAANATPAELLVAHDPAARTLRLSLATSGAGTESLVVTGASFQFRTLGVAVRGSSTSAEEAAVGRIDDLRLRHAARTTNVPPLPPPAFPSVAPADPEARDLVDDALLCTWKNWPPSSAPRAAEDLRAAWMLDDAHYAYFGFQLAELPTGLDPVDYRLEFRPGWTLRDPSWGGRLPATAFLEVVARYVPGAPWSGELRAAAPYTFWTELAPVASIAAVEVRAVSDATILVAVPRSLLQDPPPGARALDPRAETGSFGAPVAASCDYDYVPEGRDLRFRHGTGLGRDEAWHDFDKGTEGFAIEPAGPTFVSGTRLRLDALAGVAQGITRPLSGAWTPATPLALEASFDMAHGGATRVVFPLFAGPSRTLPTAAGSLWARSELAQSSSVTLAVGYTPTGGAAPGFSASLPDAQLLRDASGAALRHFEFLLEYDPDGVVRGWVLEAESGVALASFAAPLPPGEAPRFAYYGVGTAAGVVPASAGHVDDLRLRGGAFT